MSYDNCRVCGGSNENCNTIDGLFNSSDLVVGYNDILLIPAGATNVLIKEEGKGSNNYLGKIGLYISIILHILMGPCIRVFIIN